MAGTFTALCCHIVFSTKDRRPMITSDIKPRLLDYIGGVIRGENGSAMEINAMPDHAHILARRRADAPLSVLVQKVKSHSSGWIHREFPDARAFTWQEGYGAFAVSKSQVGRVAAYIRDQEEHHAVKDFRQELLALLEAHGVDYDAERIWL